MILYLIGSLRNPRVPELANEIRELGLEVFDDWYAAGPEADDRWRDYEQGRDHDIVEALEGHAANHVFDFDTFHLNRCDASLLLLPSGRSGHYEQGYMAGLGKPNLILLDGEPERYDVMYRFATQCFRGAGELFQYIKENYVTEAQSKVPDSGPSEWPSIREPKRGDPQGGLPNPTRGPEPPGNGGTTPRIWPKLVPD